MANPRGNPGNKGGPGRKTLAEELKMGKWHQEKWEIDTDVEALKAKLQSGHYSVRDVVLAKALQGQERILQVFMNKLLPDLHDMDITSAGNAINLIIYGSNDSLQLATRKTPTTSPPESSQVQSASLASEGSQDDVSHK